MYIHNTLNNIKINVCIVHTYFLPFAAFYVTGNVLKLEPNCKYLWYSQYTPSRDKAPKLGQNY